MKVPCICINDSMKPKEVDANEWIIRDNEYHIHHIYYHTLQGIQGVLLTEVSLSDKSKPYEAYALKRFAFKKEHVDLLMALLIECNELNNISIKELKDILQPQLQD